MRKINPAELLISDYLELKLLEPNSQEWGSDVFNKNPPRYYRLERIKSCLKALGMHPMPVMRLEAGKFLKDFSQSEIIKIEETLSRSFSIDVDTYITERDSSQMPSLFQGLLKLLVNLNTIDNCFSGVLAASDHYLTPVLIAEQISDAHGIKKRTIKEVLVDMVNRSGVLLSLDSLIEDHDFPNVDIDEVDIEWM